MIDVSERAIQVRFTVSPAVLYGAQRAAMQRIRWMRWAGLFAVLGFPVLLIAIYLAYGRGPMLALRNNAVLILGFPLFWLIGVPLLQRWTAGRTLRNTPSLQGELVYAFSPEGLDVRTSVTTAHLTWESIVRATETKAFILLFQNKAMAMFVPKSAFGATELDQVRALISQAIGSRAQWSARPVQVPAAP